MKIGITGANGFIGSHLTEYLLSQGHKVTCLVRKTSNLRWIQDSPVDFVYGDVRDSSSLKPFVDGKDGIFHLAGMVKARSEEEIMEANAGGTEKLARAVADHAPDCKRLLMVSSQEAVGAVEGDKPADEDIPLRPVTAYGKSKARAEEVLRERFPDLPWTVIRPSSVFGPREQEIYTFFKLVSRGIMVFPKISSRISIVYITNLIRGMTEAAFSDKTLGEAYFLADDGYFTWIELAEEIARILQKKPFRLPVPMWTARMAGNISSLYSSITGRATILNKEKFFMMSQPNLMVSNSKSVRDFGYETKVPIRDALEETSAWYKAYGWL